AITYLPDQASGRTIRPPMSDTFIVISDDVRPEPSLQNVNLKIARAKEHLGALKREILLFKKSKPCATTTKGEVENLGGQTRSASFSLTIKPAPRRAGIIAGDFATCLRTSLDHLAWQLALLQ